MRMRENVPPVRTVEYYTVPLSGKRCGPVPHLYPSRFSSRVRLQSQEHWLADTRVSHLASSMRKGCATSFKALSVGVKKKRANAWNNEMF